MFDFYYEPVIRSRQEREDFLKTDFRTTMALYLIGMALSVITLSSLVNSEYHGRPSDNSVDSSLTYTTESINMPQRSLDFNIMRDI